MAALFVSAFLVLAAELCENVVQLVVNVLVPQKQVFLVLREESVLRNVYPALVDNDLAGRDRFWQQFLGRFLVLDPEECQALLFQANDDLMNNVMGVVKHLVVSTPVQLEVSSRRVLEIGDEMVNQVVNVQHSCSLLTNQ